MSERSRCPHRDRSLTLAVRISVTLTQVLVGPRLSAALITYAKDGKICDTRSICMLDEVSVTQTKDGAFYSVSQAAKLLGVSPSTVWRWIEADRLAAYRVGPKTIRIRKQDLETVIRPARAERIMASPTFERLGIQPPTRQELARRQALVEQILARRARRVISPLTTTDLIRQVREDERKSYGKVRTSC